MATKEELMKQLATKGKGGTLSPLNIVIPRSFNPSYSDMGDFDPHEFEDMDVAEFNEMTKREVKTPPKDVFLVVPEKRFVLQREADDLTRGKVNPKAPPFKEWYVKKGGEKTWKRIEEAEMEYNKEFGGAPKYTKKQVVPIKDAKAVASIDTRLINEYDAFIDKNSTTEIIQEKTPVEFKKEEAGSPDEWAHKLSEAGVPDGTMFKFKGRIYKVKSTTDVRNPKQMDPKEVDFDDPHHTDKSDPVDF